MSSVKANTFQIYLWDAKLAISLIPGGERK
jgi:hypothetical protein